MNFTIANFTLNHTFIHAVNKCIYKVCINSSLSGSTQHALAYQVCTSFCIMYQLEMQASLVFKALNGRLLTRFYNVLDPNYVEHQFNFDSVFSPL